MNCTEYIMKTEEGPIETLWEIRYPELSIVDTVCLIVHDQRTESDSSKISATMKELFDIVQNQMKSRLWD